MAELRTRTRDPLDRPTAIASVHALARIPGDGVDDILAEILDESPRDLVAHVAWAGAARTFAPSLLDRFVALVVAGGLPGMHAQAALEAWSRTDPWLVAAAIREGIARTTAPAGRRHLVETLGLVPDPTVLDDLARHATDAREGDAARIAAIAAFGDRAWEPMARQASSLSSGTGPIADASALARMDRVATRRAWRDRPTRRGPRPSARAGLRIAQLHLGAELDPEMRRAGVGATGGIATLLVDLDRALNRRSGIDSVMTIGRGTADDVLRPAGPSGDQGFRPVPLRPEEDAAFLGDWPARVAAERGIRRILGGDGQPDVLHLRMADVGSLAGSRVAAESGIRTVFSLAPDPHGLIAAREAAGELDRATFGGEDARAHLWFRARLVESLARDADQVVLFPREHLAQQL
ncbi:MAG: glycosyltransferase family 4 protein, partial [Chloroflexi bacterium]|nr:glycosyltransferase family 4 protein [Chloroflexota bacterium]